MLRRSPLLLLLPACSWLMACGSSDSSSTSSSTGGPGGNEPQPDVLADLRADSNRDGEVRFDDDSDKNKTDWNKTTGAIFLANIDDDNLRCKATGDDVTIVKCNDAADDVINGEDDALDIARLKTKPWPKTPDDATATIAIATESAKEQVRLFRKTGPEAVDFTALAGDEVFTAEDIKAGLEFGIEAKDIVRDTSVWDGYVDITFTVTSPSKGNSTDTVHMRVAPVLTPHHLLPAEKVWVSNTNRPGNKAMRTDLASSCSAAGIEKPNEIDVDDPWAQDFFETGFMTMPGAKGEQHVMRVNYRSANVFEPSQPKAPLRPAGQFVFKLRGKDVAGIQQYDIKHSGRMDSLNSFGNFETIPPHENNGESYPFGRVLRGRTKSFFPDTSFDKMIESQGQQPMVDIDTSWLLVGHVDETMSFVKAPTPRGWMLLVNDARMAKKMLEDQVAAGKGDTQMFVGKSWVDFDTGKESNAAISIKDVLADDQVMQASAEAAAEIDAQLDKVKKEVGLSDDEIIKVPFLHTTISGQSAAYLPGTVNGIYVSDTHFGSPDPHGPVINGKDIFKASLEDSLKKVGVTVDWIEDWDEYHLGVGEVHCGSNTTRKIPEIKWWESGR